MSNVDTVVRQYKISCVTESNVQYQWDINEPSQCLNAYGHQISVDYIPNSENQFFKLWSENNLDTKRGFCVESRDLPIMPNSNVQHFDLSFPIATSLYSVYYNVNSNHIGDFLECQLIPDTTIGSIIKDVNPGDDKIYVTDSVLDHAHPGYDISLQNPNYSDDLDICVQIDYDNKYISCAKQPTKLYSCADFDTRVKMTCKTMKNFKLQSEGMFEIGRQNSGGRYIPANTVFRLLYTNNTPDIFKWFYIYFEYTY